jgi:hypothetical protein
MSRRLPFEQRRIQKENLKKTNLFIHNTGYNQSTDTFYLVLVNLGLREGTHDGSTHVVYVYYQHCQHECRYKAPVIKHGLISSLITASESLETCSSSGIPYLSGHHSILSQYLKVPIAHRSLILILLVNWSTARAVYPYPSVMKMRRSTPRRDDRKVPADSLAWFTETNQSSHRQHS